MGLYLARRPHSARTALRGPGPTLYAAPPKDDAAGCTIQQLPDFQPGLGGYIISIS